MRALPFLVLTLGACSGDEPATSLTGDSAEPIPSKGTTVSLADDVVPIMRDECGFCHTRTDSPSAPAVANDVYLERKNDLLGLVGTDIVAGDSAKSRLVAWLRQEEGAGNGPTLMPPPTSGRDKMSRADIQVVRAWIDEGALDN